MTALVIDPLALSIASGLCWPLAQAVIDRVEWTPDRRRVVAIVAAVVLTGVIWLIGQYPAQWEFLVAQAGVILGSAQASFTLLKKWGVLDWVGLHTPGGEEPDQGA